MVTSSVLSAAPAHELVHKSVEAATLVGGWTLLTEGLHFRVEVCWVKSRSRIFSASDFVDVVAVAETTRQVAVMVSHVGFGVPGDSAFVMTSLSVRCEAALSTMDEVERRSVTADARCYQVTKRGEALDTMTVHVTFAAAGGVVVARGTGDLRVLPLPVYRRLRGLSLPVHHLSNRTRVPPGEAGRTDLNDVVIGRDGNNLRMVIDTSHRGFYDHFYDHVPGMAIIEACRQAAVWHGRREQTAMQARFHAYLEIGPDPFLSVEHSTLDTVITLVQDGLAKATVAFE